MKIAVIFGGSGFLGASTVRQLLQKNYRVKVITRDKEKVSFLKTFAAPEFLTLVEWNYQNYQRIEEFIAGADLVVNLIGIIAESKKGDFTKYHIDLPKIIAQKSEELHVKNLVHLSALGVDKITKSQYATSKLAGEKAILENFSHATILRPSIIFGPRDNFFNKFAKMAKPLKILPLIHNGVNKFQPIYVEDLAEIIAKIPENKKARNKIYEIGCDKTYSFKQLMQLLGSYLGYELKFINLSFIMAKILACFLESFSKEILTSDQVEMLKIDNVLSENNFKKDFAINPKSVEEIVPNYIY